MQGLLGRCAGACVHQRAGAGGGVRARLLPAAHGRQACPGDGPLCTPVALCSMCMDPKHQSQALAGNEGSLLRCRSCCTRTPRSWCASRSMRGWRICSTWCWTCAAPTLRRSAPRCHTWRGCRRSACPRSTRRARCAGCACAWASWAACAPCSCWTWPPRPSSCAAAATCTSRCAGMITVKFALVVTHHCHPCTLGRPDLVHNHLLSIYYRIPFSGEPITTQPSICKIKPM